MVGKPRRAIPRVARREKVELLVLGKSDKQNAVSAMMGSVAESVADRAPCSVFIVGREYQTSITAATVQP
jgi:nucleotide-binding universal stress UspA family protein